QEPGYRCMSGIRLTASARVSQRAPATSPGGRGHLRPADGGLLYDFPQVAVEITEAPWPDRRSQASAPGVLRRGAGLGRVRDVHLAAEQLADLGQVRRDALLLLVELVDLALRGRAHPVGLGLGVGQELIGLRFGLRDDLVGVLLRVADQLAGVLVGVTAGLLPLGGRLALPLLCPCGPRLPLS